MRGDSVAPRFHTVFTLSGGAIAAGKGGGKGGGGGGGDDATEFVVEEGQNFRTFRKVADFRRIFKGKKDLTLCKSYGDVLSEV